MGLGEYYYPDKQTLGTPALVSWLNNYEFPSVLTGISNQGTCMLGGGFIPRQSNSIVV